MKIILRCSLLFLFTIWPYCHSSAQDEDSGYPPDSYDEIVLDQSQYEFFYDYNYILYTKKGEYEKNGLTVLQIGAEYVKFFDFYTMQYDSLNKRYKDQKSLLWRQSDSLTNTSQKKTFDKETFINRKDRSVLVQALTVIGYNRYKIDPSPNFNWKFLNKKKEILNHPVKKAVLHHAGRDWVAWYAEDIPLPYGPYIFGGLPGLILELHDTEENFHFRLSGISKNSRPIYRRIEEEYWEDVTEKEYYDLERKFHNHPDMFINNWGDSDPIPYHPIEIYGK